MTTTKPTDSGSSDAGADRSILTDLKVGPSSSSDVAPDMGGVNPTSTKSKYKVHSQTLVIALVLAASGAALYMMRKQGMGSGVNFNPPKIDYDLDKTRRTASDAQQEKILADLERSQNPLQVPAERIPKNPFQLDTGAPVKGAPTDPNMIADMKAREEQERINQRAMAIVAALGTIEVGSIMEGPTPLARINGKIVREGDTVGDLFKVKEIHDRSVDLTADGKIYTVNMAENAGGGRPRTPPPRK